MTSEVDSLQTNELLQRRNLRLQQVREQSKEIAKKIRQRAKAETLRRVKEVDTKKEKEYLECQKNFVKRLQEIHADGLQNIGVGHKNASAHFEEDVDQKLDKSKLRGKEAAAAVRRKKQEILNKKKQLLDRKLQAREAANELSREKSTIVAKHFHISVKDSNVVSDNKEVHDNQNSKLTTDMVKKVDMATQSNLDEPSNECQADITVLQLPENESIKDGANEVVEKLDKCKRPNLFAISDEMPSSLRGGLSSIPQEFIHIKPSLTLVSEYLQNRKLRLRETESESNKKQIEDLQKIKQTILRTRASKTEVQGSNKENSMKTSTTDSTATRKSSVMMYDHSTRDIRTLPFNNENLVVRDQITEDDAFSKAEKEKTNDNLKEKEQQDKTAERRNKIAMTKENVDKEYRDTLAFLNSLPNDMSNKTIKKAYMDENRQQQLKEKHQLKLQQEFNSIEKEYRRHKCKHAKSHIHSRSKSPYCDKEDKDFQEYSWMPVPEREGNLAIHTIPTSDRGTKYGNTVKFSKNDTYHEYRSRHKHTPPTKDIPNSSKLPKNKYIETVLIEQNGNYTDCSSVASDSSSVENIILNKKEKRVESSEEFDPKLSDADRIIIYKILNSKRDKKKKCHKKFKLDDKNAKPSESTDYINNDKCSDNSSSNKPKQNTDQISDVMNKATNQQLSEGVYMAVKENGDNVTSLRFSENPATTECAHADAENKTSHRCCHHVKDNSKGADTNTLLKGNGYLERPARKCDCVSGTNNLEVPSAVTSSSSFKTTAYEKTEAVPIQNGYIKLIDEGVQENGKFYVGASGFLKDEAYEVIIQLRKKELSVKDGDKCKQQDVIADKSTIIQFENNTNLQHATDKVLVNEDKNKESEQKTESNQKQSETPNEIIPQKISTLPPEIIAKQDATEISNHLTSITDSNQAEDKQINNESDKDSPHTNLCEVPKNATSAYTQTTNSPFQRPLFMHMSSSTSTAYMSPPEIILPRFLRRDNDLPCDESYDSAILNEIQNMQQHEVNKHCRCKGNIGVRKRTYHPVNEVNDCKKINYQFRNLNTPPNTARSTDMASVYTNKKYEICPESLDSKIHGKCSKCETHHKYKCNKQINRDKYVNHAYKHSPILHEVSSSASNKHIRIVKPSVSKRTPKNALNPLIKQYVNKLLELNKEGMKAVEIINEECSSVQTPSSSIINNSLNINAKLSHEQKISLEQIKNIVKEKLINDRKPKDNEVKGTPSNSTTTIINKNFKIYPKLSRRKQPHKIKSLNISKKVSKTKKKNESSKYIYQTQSYKPTSLSSSLKNDISDHPFLLPSKMSKPNQKRSKTSGKSDSSIEDEKLETTLSVKKISELSTIPSRLRSNTTPISTDSENTNNVQNNNDKLEQPPAHISTQTSGNFDSDNNYMKVAEGKLQNMEKIADLTEKCTKRLSNLAKVLEEVRRHKSLVYSQITTSESTSESDLERNRKSSTPPLVQFSKSQSPFDKMSPPTITSEEEKEKNAIDINTFIPILTDIPKPTNLKTPLPSPLLKRAGPPSNEININIESSHFKQRGKPPPALSRIHLKNEQENIIPHELSTVLEVDSPMSLKLKSQSRHDVNANISNNSNKSVDDIHAKGDNNATRKITPPGHKISRTDFIDPDLVQNNTNAYRKLTKTSSTDSPDNSKLQMMDMKQFNEIMLKPFISIQEYAKKQNVESPEQALNMDDHVKKAMTTDDLSSLHSEGSLPDVIAELLKRKIINEPFKFDTASNVNSSTISSESTVSVLALSNLRKERKKPSMLLQNIKNITETSDTLSISSNPDLENAFKKLGMGWASSTLKKTKERLALSSSSNTSSSSGTQLKGKHRNNAQLTSDSIPSLINIIKSPHQAQNAIDSSKNVEQQTSLPNSMTVKEFLTNELAKRITFTNQSVRNVTDEEFISLYETKMPEEMKQIVREDDLSNNSVANCTNNRARTSTPVQMFRSMTYHSTSSSNTTNGLFSNADDLSSVKGTSNSIRNHSTSDKDDLTIPNYILKTSKRQSDYSKSD